MQALVSEIHFIRQICDYLQESVIWVVPVWDNGNGGQGSRIIDFELRYSNPATEELIGRSAASLTGKQILRDNLPDPSATQLIFNQCVEVYRNGNPLEYSYYSTGLDKFVNLYRIKLKDGILITIRNLTEEYKTSIEKERQSKLLQNLVDNSPYGISLYESIRDKTGNISDFRLKICNKRAAEMTSLSTDQLYRNTVKELMLLRGHSNYFDVCKKVVETGESQYLEYYAKERDKWLGFSIVKFEDGYLLNYIDITENKKLQLQLSENANELDAIFNASLNAVYTAKILRNDLGRIYDIQFLRVNDSFHLLFGTIPEQVPKMSLLSISNASDQSRFISCVQSVIDSGRPMKEILKYNNPDRSFEFSMVKLKEETILVSVNETSQISV